MNELDKYIEEKTDDLGWVGITDSPSEEFVKEICEGYYKLKSDLLNRVIGSLDEKQLHSELKAYAKWYQMDEMRRTESERFDTIIDRYLEQKD